MPFSLKDPNLFQDEDGRLYFYWGCSSDTQIQGIELDRETMQPIGRPVPLITSNAFVRGYERVGEDNAILPLTDEEVELQLDAMLNTQGQKREDVPAFMLGIMKAYLKHAPYIEGAG